MARRWQRLCGKGSRCAHSRWRRSLGSRRALQWSSSASAKIARSCLAICTFCAASRVAPTSHPVQVYVRNKVKQCENCAIRSIVHELPGDISQRDAEETVPPAPFVSSSSRSSLLFTRQPPQSPAHPTARVACRHRRPPDTPPRPRMRTCRCGRLTQTRPCTPYLCSSPSQITLTRSAPAWVSWRVLSRAHAAPQPSPTAWNVKRNRNSGAAPQAALLDEIAHDKARPRPALRARPARRRVHEDLRVTRTRAVCRTWTASTPSTRGCSPSAAARRAPPLEPLPSPCPPHRTPALSLRATPGCRAAAAGACMRRGDHRGGGAGLHSRWRCRARPQA
jgi:hypothetical protein